jgi:hypothetical protein
MLDPRVRAALGAMLLAALLSPACRNGEMFRPYEYEEDLYLSLDGSATMYVNASVASLVALRGADFDVNPRARLDRARVRALFSSPSTHVQRVTTSRRHGRLYVHVRIDVDDVRSLGTVGPFSWSQYRFERRGDLFVFDQSVGASASREIPDVGWDGSEFVGFRLHLPSKIPYHNAAPDNLRRGNILVWEQKLADRAAGAPLRMEARMETESILYRTLWLFVLCIAAVAVMFAAIVWWVARKGVPEPALTSGR